VIEQRAEVLELARKVLDAEIHDRDDPDQVGTAIETCFQRLHDVIHGLVGEAGFEALLARATRMSESQVGALKLTVKPAAANARFPGLRERLATDVTVTDGITSVLAALLALLGRFLGEDLVLQVIRRTWAGVISRDLTEGRAK
jgi:hypothetical protein